MKKTNAYTKTEKILYSYPALKKAEPTEKVNWAVRKVEEALNEIINDPYYDIIPMVYFDRLTQEDVAFRLGVYQSSVSRMRTRLINKIKIVLFPDEVIDELFS